MTLNEQLLTDALAEQQRLRKLLAECRERLRVSILLYGATPAFTDPEREQVADKAVEKYQ